MVGWTCPEELELNRLFRFLVEDRDKIRCSSCRQAATTIQKWQRLVSGIRHAAVHRLLQDRESLLRMTRVAIGFSLYRWTFERGEASPSIEVLGR